MWQKIKSSLFLQVIIALILGIVIGLSFHDFSLNLKPLGDGFISLIKMLIALLCFVLWYWVFMVQVILKNGKSWCKNHSLF
jgi:aerobic C4-dicarboxylate transport protein